MSQGAQLQGRRPAVAGGLGLWASPRGGSACAGGFPPPSPLCPQSCDWFACVVCLLFKILFTYF